VLFANLMHLVEKKTVSHWPTFYDKQIQKVTKKNLIIPPDRTGFLGVIVQAVKQYRKFSEEQVDIARKLFQLKGTKHLVGQHQ